jgi:hypothetical protein
MRLHSCYHFILLTVLGVVVLVNGFVLDKAATRSRRRNDHVRTSPLPLSANEVDKDGTVQKQGEHYSRPMTPRSLAVQALMDQKRGQFAVQLLESNPGYKQLEDQRHRSFARLLVSTVERRMGQIDKILSLYADVYPPKKVRFLFNYHYVGNVAFLYFLLVCLMFFCVLLFRGKIPL